MKRGFDHNLSSKRFRRAAVVVCICLAVLILAVLILMRLGAGGGSAADGVRMKKAQMLRKQWDEPLDVSVEMPDNTEAPEENGDGNESSQENGEGAQGSGSSRQISFDIDLGALAGLSGESIPWGTGTDTDEFNRPNGAVAYQELYGHYSADFIRENSSKIYLTMDEGYENGYTPAILDTLKEKGVHAVFFVTMDYVKRQPDLVRRMIAEGHVVGAHSVTHPADGMPSLSLEAQLGELRDLHEYVRQEFGYEMYLFRYPAGIFSEQSLALVQAAGYRSVFWSFAYRDWVTDDQPSAEEAMEKIMGRLHPGAIYLLHAVSATNTQVLGDFIDQARAQGYEFAEYR